MVSQGTNDRGSAMNKGNGPKRSYQEKSESGKGKFQRNNGPRSNNNSKPGYGKPKSDSFDRNRGYNKFSNKDDDEEDNSRRSKPMRPKESKPSVAIPDKDKTMLRLEKEQKTMKKKQQTKKKESSRPQPKVKRANNVNYTRNYANGDYDDYYDEF